MKNLPARLLSATLLLLFAACVAGEFEPHASSPKAFLVELERFVNTGDVANPEDAERHFGLSINLLRKFPQGGASYDVENRGAFASSRFAFIQSADGKDSGLSVWPKDSDLCIRESDVEGVFGRGRKSVDNVPRIIHFRTPDAEKAYLAKKKRELGQQLSYNSLGPNHHRVTLDFGVYECAQNITISKPNQ
jgi:hypothetical protein